MGYPVNEDEFALKNDLILHAHVLLHLLHFSLCLWIIHHLGQDSDDQQRQHHHQDHWVHEDVGHLPLLPLLEVAHLAQSLHAKWIRNLCHLK